MIHRKALAKIKICRHIVCRKPEILALRFNQVIKSGRHILWTLCQAGQADFTRWEKALRASEKVNGLGAKGCEIKYNHVQDCRKAHTLFMTLVAVKSYFRYAVVFKIRQRGKSRLVEFF